VTGSLNSSGSIPHGSAHTGSDQLTISVEHMNHIHGQTRATGSYVQRVMPESQNLPLNLAKLDAQTPPVVGVP
jgi:hypothetical protein